MTAIDNSEIEGDVAIQVDANPIKVNTITGQAGLMLGGVQLGENTKTTVK